MKLTDEERALMRKLAVRGGEAGKGKAKARSREHYARLAALTRKRGAMVRLVPGMLAVIELAGAFLSELGELPQRRQEKRRREVLEALHAARVAAREGGGE
jgi:hypothetical protein